MKLSDFLRDKLLAIFAFGALGIFIAVFLSALGMGWYAAFFLTLAYAAVVVAVFAREFAVKRAYYNTVLGIFQKLDQKYLISELIEPGDFAESAVLCELLRGANKAMNDRIAGVERVSADYREYIETWVHEIKTPIASARLTAENNPGPAMKRMEEDLARIEALVMNVLFYARSGSVEKDYVVRELPLKELCAGAAKKNARQLIEGGMRVELGKLGFLVYTDEKWMDFILGQLISNAVKYRKGGSGAIRFWAEAGAQGVTLHVKDEGVGIPEKDLPRVFEKGFTGENGRKYAKSTGIGLYLCKKLCDKLGVGIAARPDGGAEILLTFPKGEYYMK